MIISFIIYSFVIGMTYVISQNCYANYTFTNKNRSKMPFTVMVVISLLFVFYNYYVTTLTGQYGGDRYNYYMNFIGRRESPSLGLTFLMNLMHRFGWNFNTLLYLTTFFCVFFSLVAYRILEFSTPISILLLLGSQYGIYNFYALKQCYANTFAVLALAFMLKEESSRRSDALSIICIILAIYFHDAGFVLIPIYIMGKSASNKKAVAVSVALLIIIMLYFRPIMLGFGRLIDPVIPGISYHINLYLNDEVNTIGEQGTLQILKGFPIYIITFWGWINRKYYCETFYDFDRYLFLSFCASLIYILSFYNGWIYRLIYLIAFPSYLLFGKMMEIENNKFNRIVLKIFVVGGILFLTYRFIYLIYALNDGIF